VPAICPKHARLALVLLALFSPLSVSAQSATMAPKPQQTPVRRDGQHDFDPLIGTWKYHVSRLLKPLTGSTTWVEFDGTGVDRPVWDGRAQLDELVADGPSGHIEGLTLRLYNPQSHQWYLNWISSNGVGPFGPPTVGSFDDNGRGEFFDQEIIGGRMILVRYVWTRLTSASPHFEQSFSDDGGKTWEVNWITDQVRVQP